MVKIYQDDEHKILIINKFIKEIKPSLMIKNFSGKRFNDPKKVTDDYPKGLKGEPKLSDLLTRIKDKNITYILGEVRKGEFN